jgi:hypothetical protein
MICHVTAVEHAPTAAALLTWVIQFVLVSVQRGRFPKNIKVAQLKEYVHETILWRRVCLTLKKKLSSAPDFQNETLACFGSPLEFHKTWPKGTPVAMNVPKLGETDAEMTLDDARAAVGNLTAREWPLALQTVELLHGGMDGLSVVEQHAFEQLRRNHLVSPDSFLQSISADLFDYVEFKNKVEATCAAAAAAAEEAKKTPVVVEDAGGDDKTLQTAAEGNKTADEEEDAAAGNKTLQAAEAPRLSNCKRYFPNIVLEDAVQERFDAVPPTTSGARRRGRC